WSNFRSLLNRRSVTIPSLRPRGSRKGTAYRASEAGNSHCRWPGEMIVADHARDLGLYGQVPEGPFPGVVVPGDRVLLREAEHAAVVASESVLESRRDFGRSRASLNLVSVEMIDPHLVLVQVPRL